MPKPLAIAFVIPYFYPALQYGGQPRSAYELARALAGRGHQVKVLTTDSAGATRLAPSETGDGRRRVDGVEVIYYRNVSNWLAWRRRLFWPSEMFRDMDRQLAGADVLHIHELRSTIAPAAHRAARRRALPYVLSAHGGLRHLGRKGLKTIFDAAWGNRILADAAAVIAISPVEERDARDFGVEAGRIQYLPNMLSVEDYPPASAAGVFRRRWNIERSRIVLFIGRMHWVKGVDLLVRAFRQSPLSSDSVQLVIAGNDDGQAPMLRRLVSELGLNDRVTFTGFLDHDAKLQAFADSHLTVVPSRSEVFAISAIESLLCSRPVILSDACGLHPMPGEMEGVRSFKSEDVGDLAKVLTSAMNDEAFRCAASQGRRFVTAEFGPENIAQRAESIYCKVLQS